MKKRAILLTIVGSPDSTNVRDVRTYLREFLMDERVIDVPQLLRAFLVKGIIVPFRAPKSAKKYETIWTDQGSPLIYLTEQLAEKVAAQTGLPVYVSMRYANPKPEAVLQRIRQEHPDLEELIMVPLYPHYAMSSYETAVEHVKRTYAADSYTFDLKVVPPFYDHVAYLEALAASIAPSLKEQYDHILFSYHGIPVRHVKKTDPTGSHCMNGAACCSQSSTAHAFCYRHQVIRTTELVAERLGIPKEKYSFSFQSRLGSDKWLQPYTAAQLQAFPGQGVERLLVVCPAFVSDCLETLEEIEEEGQELFLEAGGKHFHMIPCLNDRDDWVAAIETLVNEIA
ncbi:MAG: ferrochelatase [Phaeodactylibacter sp.]|nr:ferrochelatase [Phaeodactylibacter sp.]